YTLQATAAAPVVVDGRGAEVSAYLKRVQASGGKMFTAGIGWLDRNGNLRAGTGKALPKVNLGYRDYFKNVVATKKPYVSSGLISYGLGKPAVVVAVPTFDRRGQLAGVLNGAILLNPNQKQSPQQQQRNQELGF